MNPENRQLGALMKAWNIIYPIFIYFVVTNLGMTVFAMLASFLGADYEEQYMALQTASVAVAIPFIANYYRKDCDEPTAFQSRMRRELGKKSVAVRVANGALMFLAGAVAGLVLNNILAMTGVEGKSEGYQEVTKYFFSGGILFELLGACLLTPFLEELLYRGVVYGRLCDLLCPGQGDTEGADRARVTDGKAQAGGVKRAKDKEWRGRVLSMVLSALLFGVLHMNLVQFLYASVLGVMLAWFMEKSGHFYGPLLAHIGANFISVLHVETSLFAAMDANEAAFFGATVALVLVVAILILSIQWVNDRGKAQDARPAGE